MNALVEVNGLSKYYRKEIALKNLQFSFPPNTIAAILGGNGAGKTTLLKILAGLIPFSSGEILLFGVPLLKAKSRISFLSEFPYFFPEISGEKLLSVFARLENVAQPEAGLAAYHFKKEWLKLPIKQYSKGMLQRLNLLQTGLGDKELLLLDEPMSGLDPIGREWMIHKIKEWRDEGKTILFTSHLLDDVERLADQIAILHEGEILFGGEKKKLLEETSSSLLMEAYKKLHHEAVA